MKFYYYYNIIKDTHSKYKLLSNLLLKKKRYNLINNTKKNVECAVKLNHNDNKSYIRKYWTSWVTIFVMLFIIKMLHIPLLQNIPIVFVYFIYWIFVIFMNAYEGHRLMDYLKKNHPKKWEELTYLPYCGSGNVNGFKTVGFIFSSNDLADENIKFLKNNYKKLCGFMLTVLICFPILFILERMIIE